MTGANLKEAFEHLYRTGAVHTQKEFAATVGLADATVSRVFKSLKRLSDSTALKLDKAFPGVFAMNWLLHGEGSMLAVKEDNSTQPAKTENAVLLQLLQMMQQRDERIERLEAEITAMRNTLAKLERAYHGYASIAADGGITTEKVGVVK